MARLARLCVPGWPHLVLQRGHSRQPVFADDVDRQLFRGLLQEAAVRHGVAIHAYGLLDEEIRLLGTPASTDSLSKMMQAIGRRYVSAFNRRHSHAGSLWEGRFRATIIEPERHLLDCMLFTEGLASGRADGAHGELAWCSGAHHLGLRVDSLLSDHLLYWSLGNTPFEREAAYRQLLERPLTHSQILGIQAAAAKGWPLGSAAFLDKVSEGTSRRLSGFPVFRMPMSTATIAAA